MTKALELARADLVDLVRRASTDIPDDVEAAIRAGRDREESGSRAWRALDMMLDNIRLARARSVPLCQDTGTPLFWVRHPVGFSTATAGRLITAACREATRRSFLRPNTVDPITGKNPGDGVGVGIPHVEFREWGRAAIRVDVVLKGGGCENVGIQYSLPDVGLDADRNRLGVLKCVIDSVVKAAGKGCAPGVLGVAIGGDRSVGYLASKEVFLRPLGDRNPDPVLAELEAEVFEKANALGIGPMGFGGRTTVLGVRAARLHRLPASFFVTVSYMCWSFRRCGMTVTGRGVRYDRPDRRQP